MFTAEKWDYIFTEWSKNKQVTGIEVVKSADKKGLKFSGSTARRYLAKFRSGNTTRPIAFGSGAHMTTLKLEGRLDEMKGAAGDAHRLAKEGRFHEMKGASGDAHRLAKEGRFHEMKGAAGDGHRNRLAGRENKLGGGALTNHRLAKEGRFDEMVGAAGENHRLARKRRESRVDDSRVEWDAHAEFEDFDFDDC